MASLDRHFRVRSLFRVLDYYEAEANSAPSPTKAYEYTQERRHVIQEFLEDPGYADEGTLELVRAKAPDALSASELQTYRVGPWLRHCALRFAETLVHLTVLAQTVALVLGLWTGSVARFPLAAEWLLSVWAILLYADAMWTFYVSRVARALLLNDESWQSYSFSELIDMTVEGLPWWQRPAAWLIAPIAKRVVPPGVRTRTA